MLSVIWFSTGRDREARELFLNTMYEMIWGSLKGKAIITKVFCNREWGESQESDEFLRLVESIGVAIVCLSSGQFRENYGGSDWRNAYDRQVIQMLEQDLPDKKADFKVG